MKLCLSSTRLPWNKWLLSTFQLKYSFRALHGNANTFSRYYNCNIFGSRVTRIDRCYNYGQLTPVSALYVPVALSDHMAHIISFYIPSAYEMSISPWSRPLFKIKLEIIKVSLFQSRLSDAMSGWKEVKERGLGTLRWWDKIVKLGIKKLVI